MCLCSIPAAYYPLICRYFDVTPRGRLVCCPPISPFSPLPAPYFVPLFSTPCPPSQINRFSSDTNTVDGDLISRLSSFFEIVFFMAAILLTEAIVAPWTMLVIVPLVIFYYWVNVIYRNTSRELKRLVCKAGGRSAHNVLPRIRPFLFLFSWLSLY